MAGGATWPLNEMMNRHFYTQVLRDNMLPWATGVFGQKWVGGQDNMLPHVTTYYPDKTCLGSNIYVYPRQSGWIQPWRAVRVRALTDGMACHVQAVLAARGGHMCYYTNYYITYPCTMGFGHPAFSWFYINGYENGGNIAMALSFSPCFTWVLHNIFKYQRR